MNVLDILDEIDMLPCPFCGNEEPRLRKVAGNPGSFAEAYCPVCNVRMMSDGSYKTYAEARTVVVRTWNRRWSDELGDVQ